MDELTRYRNNVTCFKERWKIREYICPNEHAEYFQLIIMELLQLRTTQKVRMLISEVRNLANDVQATW